MEPLSYDLTHVAYFAAAVVTGPCGSSCELEGCQNTTQKCIQTQNDMHKMRVKPSKSLEQPFFFGCNKQNVYLTFSGIVSGRSSFAIHLRRKIKACSSTLLFDEKKTRHKIFYLFSKSLVLKKRKLALHVKICGVSSCPKEQ